MLDSTDGTLLRLLSEDARRQYAELGKEVHLSPPAVHARVKKLEQAGVIRSYTVRIDPQGVGKPVCAFIRIMASKDPCKNTARQLLNFSEIEECHSVAGEDCLLVKARTATPRHLEDLLMKIRQIPNVERTVTTMVLHSHFERGTDAMIDN